MVALLSFAITTLIASAVLHVVVKTVTGRQTATATFGTALVTNVLWAVTFAIGGVVPVVGWLLSLIVGFVILMKMYGVGFFMSALIFFILMVVWFALGLFMALVAGVSFLSFLGLATLFV